MTQFTLKTTSSNVNKGLFVIVVDSKRPFEDNLNNNWKKASPTLNALVTIPTYMGFEKEAQ